MRPGDFSPGNLHELARLVIVVGDVASMRPGDFSPGNNVRVSQTPIDKAMASMRPGDFSPGNCSPRTTPSGGSPTPCFNEAGGFLPRKPAAYYHVLKSYDVLQ